MNGHIKYLLQQYVNRAETDSERRELAAWALAPENKEMLQLLLTELWDQTSANEDIDSEKAKEIFEKIINSNSPKPSVISWKRFVAAASVIALIGLCVYFFMTIGNRRVTTSIVDGKLAGFPAPATNRAMITLADGSQVFLDSAGNGELVKVGNIKLIKKANGQIAYQTTAGQILREMQYNTLTNPRGSRVIDILLSDGSRVWLNAGSSITYPVAFLGNEREVELKGEGYFEVAKDVSKKFIVKANGTTTEILGTHFNINAYEGKKTVEVTLLKGSVKVKSSVSGNGKIIKPGQQAQIAEQIDIVTADIDQIMAWRRDMFDFGERTDIHIAMDQLARWYGFDVEYESGLNAYVGGEISRNEDGKNVLKLLEKTGSVHFKNNGSKIIVMSP